MPLFEYRCQNCRRRVTVLVRTPSQDTTPICEHCGSPNLSRLISRFAVHRSAGDSLDSAPDSEAFGDVNPEDPKAMAGWMRRMQKEMGEESTPEFEEMVDELESGRALEDDGDDDDAYDDL